MVPQLIRFAILVPWIVSAACESGGSEPDCTTDCGGGGAADAAGAAGEALSSGNGGESAGTGGTVVDDGVSDDDTAGRASGGAAAEDHGGAGSGAIADDDAADDDAADDDAADDDAADDDAADDDAADDDASDDDVGAEPSSARLRAVPIDSTEAGLGFWEYLPPGYGAEPKPLLVFTHGAAWQGSGSEEDLQDLLEVGPPNLQSTDAWPNERPFIVLSPQNPRAGCFDPDDIDGLYRYALDNYDVDRSRIYHTGQSCGAIGAWAYLADHLDEFVTAAVLISGDGHSAWEQAGCDLGRIAIWGLHNENDTSVASTGTTEPLESLLGCDPTPDIEITIYPDETAHDAWTKTYDLSAGNDIYSWLLEHTHP